MEGGVGLVVLVDLKRLGRDRDEDGFEEYE